MLYSQISDEPQATDNMECSPPAEDCAEVEDVGDAVEEVIGEDHAAVEVLHFLFACCILNVNLRNIKITIEAYLPLPPLLSTAHRIHLAGSNGCKQLLEPTVGNMRASPPAKTTDPTGNLTTVEIKGYEENIKTIAVDHSELKKNVSIWWNLGLLSIFKAGMPGSVSSSSQQHLLFLGVIDGFFTLSKTSM